MKVRHGPGPMLAPSPPMAPGSQARRRQRRSAGILLYRLVAGGLEVLLVHPGGPVLDPARRGSVVDSEGRVRSRRGTADRRPSRVRLKSSEPSRRRARSSISARYARSRGKYVRAWALEGDLDATAITSNTFTLEWPPRSGRTSEFPEVDRAELVRARGGAREDQPRPGAAAGSSRAGPVRVSGSRLDQPDGPLHRLRLVAQRALDPGADDAEGRVLFESLHPLMVVSGQARPAVARGLPARPPPRDRRAAGARDRARSRSPR